jgi:mono/diheme cytochrome c family protein
MQWKATGSVQTKARRPDQRWIRLMGMPAMRAGRNESFPKIRAAVTICPRAKTPAAVANHAFAAIAELKIAVTMSVYVPLTLATIAADATQYDRRVSTSVRLVLVPVLLFAVVTGAVFALAKLHLARPELRTAANAKVQLGDFYNGETVFSQKCASCHGQHAEGTKIAPKLVDDTITLAAAKAQIDNGGSVMPAKLVTGKQERDVLAYLATILKPS